MLPVGEKDEEDETIRQQYGPQKMCVDIYLNWNEAGFRRPKNDMIASMYFYLFKKSQDIPDMWIGNFFNQLQDGTKEKFKEYAKHNKRSIAGLCMELIIRISDFILLPEKNYTIDLADHWSTKIRGRPFKIRSYHLKNKSDDRFIESYKTAYLSHRPRINDKPEFKINDITRYYDFFGIHNSQPRRGTRKETPKPLSRRSQVAFRT